METALATVIVGVGTLSMFTLVGTCINQTRESSNLTAGMNLARNIRELSLSMAFTDTKSPNTWGLDGGESASNPATWNDVNDLDGRTISPPITATRTPLTSMAGWSQQITVTSVTPDRLTLQAPRGSTACNQVTVVVLRDGKQVCTLSWMVFKAAS